LERVGVLVVVPPLFVLGDAGLVRVVRVVAGVGWEPLLEVAEVDRREAVGRLDGAGGVQAVAGGGNGPFDVVLAAGVGRDGLLVGAVRVADGLGRDALDLRERAARAVVVAVEEDPVAVVNECSADSGGQAFGSPQEMSDSVVLNGVHAHCPAAVPPAKYCPADFSNISEYCA
jgi:hypothetical protein